MRVLPAALVCALVLGACARTHVERHVPVQPATLQTVPGAKIITPAGTPPATIVHR